MSTTAVAPKFGQKISKWAKGYQKSWDDLSWIGRTYWAGLTLIAGAILPLVVDKGDPIGGGLMIAATFLLASALAYEIYAWLKPRLDSRLLTMLTGAITAVGGVFALVFAGDALNAVTGQDPEIFGYARAFLSLLMTLPLVAFAVVLASLPAMLLVAGKTIILVSKARSKEQERHLWIGFGRFLAILLSASAANHLVQPDSWLDPRFPSLAAWSANAMDMHTDASCSSNPSDRIARLNDALVVVSRNTPSGYKFFRAECALIAQEGTSP